MLLLVESLIIFNGKDGPFSWEEIAPLKTTEEEDDAIVEASRKVPFMAAGQTRDIVGIQRIGPPNNSMEHV